MSQGIGHLGAEIWPALHSQLVLAQQGELKSFIAQRRAVITQIVITALGRQCPAEGLGGVLLIPHGRECQREVQERQTGAGVIGLLLPDKTQGSERCLAHPGQYIGTVGLIGQPAVLGGTAPALTILTVGEIALQPVQRLIEHGLRHCVARLLARQQVVGGIGGEPLLLVGATIPETKTAAGQLQPLQPLQQGTLHVRLARRFLALCGFAPGGPLIGRGQQVRPGTGQGLLQTGVGVIGQRLPLDCRIPGRGAGEAEQPLQVGAIQPGQLSWRKAHLLTGSQHLVALASLGRPGGTQRQIPVAPDGKILAAGRQLQARHAARPGHGERQGQPLLFAIFKSQGAGQLAVCLEPTVEGPDKGEGLIFAAHVAQLHQCPGLIPSGAKARPANFGHQGRHHLDGALGLTHLLFVPGQRHQRQFAVEVGQVERDHRFTLLVKTHLAAPECGYLDPALQRATLFQRRPIAPIVEAGQLAILRRDHLAVVVEQILGEALAAKEDLERVEGLIIADIEHAPIHRR